MTHRPLHLLRYVSQCHKAYGLLKSVEDQSEHNPALVDLEFLSGEWDMELLNAPFLPRSDDTTLDTSRASGLRTEPCERCGNTITRETLPGLGGHSGGTNPASTI